AAAGTGVVVSGGTLCGSNGVIAAPVSIVAGGTLSPGAYNPSVTNGSKLAISNVLTLAANTVMTINKVGGIPVSDLVTNITTLNSGAILVVGNLGPTPAQGDTFTLFSATSYNGTFGTFILPPLPGSLAWDTSKLGVNGSIQVIAAGTPPVITNQPVS